MIAGMASRIAVLGGAAVAIACCAGLPAIGAALGGVTAGALIGVAAGLTTAVVLGVTGALLVRSRRRRTGTEPRR